MEILVNLDENYNLITRATITQDFRDVYPKCWVVFTLEGDINFCEGSGFMLCGIMWEAVSYKKISLAGAITYSVWGYPQGVCTIITSKFTSLSALAKGCDISFDSGLSSDLVFEFPLCNVPLGALLYKYRYSSVEENLDDPSKAYFIFYDARGLVGNSYSSLACSELLSYDVNLSSSLGGSVSFINDYMGVNYARDIAPSRHKYKNFINSFIGDKFDVSGMMPALIGSRYKLNGLVEGLSSKYGDLILVRQKYDSMKLPVPWVLTFGQLLAV